MPSGAIGVASNKKVPSNALCAGRGGLRQHGRIMLSMALLCVVSWHQWARGNDGGSPVRPAVKWFFFVQTTRLAGLVQCMLGGAILQFHLFQCNECFNVVGYFIVHFVEDGPIFLGCKPGVHLCDGPQELLFASVLDWDQPNRICIVDVEEGKVGISLVGCHWEASGIVTGRHGL
jgi:hypothetical protein